MKSSLAFLILSTVTFGLEYQSCSKITCGTGTNNQCISVYSNNNTVVVTPCSSSNSSCSDNDQFSSTTGNWTSATCEAKPAQVTSTRDCSANSTTLTGKSCCTDSNCVSGSCSSGICKGLANGANCTADEECQPGYFCKNFTSGNGTNSTSSRTCASLLSSGDACTVNNECPIGYGCNNSTCTKLFTKDINSSVSDKMFCKSDFQRNGKCDGILIYTDNSTQALSSPFKCNLGEQCKYVYASDGVTAATDWCQCGGVDNSAGYCGSFGNVIGFWDQVFPKLQYSSSDCSGRFSHTDNFTELFNCSSLSSSEQEYLTSMSDQATYWTLYESEAIDACVNQLGLFPTNVSLNSSASGAIILAISAILLIFG
ncbi:unnamed protein product [Blepharisma stoltei]|uniref:Dickkopf N-terminal cysteine-rich domain-containing protein n=1 Tax=Blepharisma stoltei TaxID=1481888 RepID=A0AAU9IB73_9CILI|nr:unnamed protein product [Blepharisma stoltei]